MSIEGIKKDYRRIDMLSASDLKLFASDRKKFYKKNILKEEEEEEYNWSTLIGNLCHTLLLEPETFDNKYFMSICTEMPTGLMLAFVEALYKHTAANTDEEGMVTKDFETLTKLAHEDSGFKITLDTVMKKFVGTNAESYYKELRESKSRKLTVVCTKDLTVAQSIVDRVRADDFIGPIFNRLKDNETVFNEKQIEGIPIKGVEMKAMLDKILVDHTNKAIQFYDLKVVWDNQNFYNEYYLKKMAFIQGAIYYLALLSGKADLGFDYSEYHICLPIFVAVDSANFYAPVMYRMSESSMEKAMEGFEERGRKYPGVKQIIEDILWCQETGYWNISKTIWENNGLVDLN